MILLNKEVLMGEKEFNLVGGEGWQRPQLDPLEGGILTAGDRRHRPEHRPTRPKPGRMHQLRSQAHRLALREWPDTGMAEDEEPEF